MIRVLYVEPSELNQKALARRGATLGYHVACVATTESALWLLGNAAFDAVLCTWRHVDAPSVLAECDRRRLPARILSGLPVWDARFSDRWIAKYDLGALDGFLAGIATARAS